MPDGGSTPAPAWLAPIVRALRPWLRDIRRAAVTGDALLTLDDVCELVPGREGDVRAWAQREVKALRGPCGTLYRWRDVLRALGAEDGQAAPPKARKAPLAVAYEEP